jgi:glycosyltransferase involved in cell wall biosynthesis
VSGTVFVFLSFEGPDRYSRVGGLATRVTGVVRQLAARGFETHLFFIGDPHLPGHEVLSDGRLHLHRWCQWISEHYPGGAYDGEDAKLGDWNRSLPAWLLSNVFSGLIASGRSAVVIGEEWQTAEVLVTLGSALAKAGWRDRVRLVWNANNTYGFDRIDWIGLQKAAVLTTVSRYMKYLMQRQGLAARAIPNGMEERWLAPLQPGSTQQLERALKGRMTLTKVARWDPEKRWDYAIDAVAAMKKAGMAPVLLARGGSPERAGDVMTRILHHGLKLSRTRWEGQDVKSMTAAVVPILGADVVLLDSMLFEDQSKLLYRVSDAVLANSSFEPFGLVGLEAMAAGGIAVVGATGEDYVTNGHDAISLQTDDVWEFIRYIARIKNYPGAERNMRVEARRSAARFTWGAVIDRALIPFVREMGLDTDDGPQPPRPVRARKRPAK